MVEVLRLQAKTTEVEALLKRLGVARALELMDYAGQEIVSASQEAFETKQDPVTGSKWKQSNNAKKDTLVDTGDLMRSVDFRTTFDDVEVGSDQVYAAVHNEGGRAGRGGSVRLPQRRFLGVPADWGRRFFGMTEIRQLLGVRDFANRG